MSYAELLKAAKSGDDAFVAEARRRLIQEGLSKVPKGGTPPDALLDEIMKAGTRMSGSKLPVGLLDHMTPPKWIRVPYEFMLMTPRRNGQGEEIWDVQNKVLMAGLDERWPARHDLHSDFDRLLGCSLSRIALPTHDRARLARSQRSSGPPSIGQRSPRTFRAA